MKLFGFNIGTSGDRFEADALEIVRQINLSFAKVQEGMRCYLLKYLEANSLPVDHQLIEVTFGWLISATPPSPGQLALARQYVEILSSAPVVQKAFGTAVVFKVNMMTSQGLMSESMRIVNNLNNLGLRVFSLGLQIPSERAFIQMANDFYEGCSTMVVKGGRVAFPEVDTVRYELREELGRGSFGIVNLAFDKRLRREVAIKRLIVDGASPHYVEFMQRLEREARIIASLNHPGVLQVFDFETMAQGCCIVMEYVRGGSLARLLAEAEGRLAYDKVAVLGAQLCEGLAHAHERGIIHRDLKPQNVLLERGAEPMRVKIADFGIARGVVPGDSVNTVGGLGTPLYMSPEQFTDARRVTKASDIYAVGKILFEMLTGKTGLDIDINSSGVPQGWRRIIERCTLRDPELRYTSAREISCDIAALEV